MLRKWWPPNRCRWWKHAANKPWRHREAGAFGRPFFLPGGQFLKQPPYRRLNEIEDLFKTVHLPVIGIRHFAGQIPLAVGQKQAQLLMVPARTGTTQPVEVVIAHRQHQIEPFKIELGDAPRPLRGKVIAAGQGGPQGAGVWRISNVVAMRACRFKMKAGIQSKALRKTSCDPLCRG